MSRRIRLIAGALALVAALGSGLYAYRILSQVSVTGQVVTPLEDVPPGGLIQANMLTTKEVPRALLEEDIYATVKDLVGRVAQVPLSAGMAVYRPFAVSPTEYRLVNDPRLEVVSFPVDPARAVGGQIQPGHRVDVWRLVSAQPARDLTLPELAATDWATATLLVRSVPVVDVRTRTGAAVAPQPQAMPGQVEGEAAGTQQGLGGLSSALQILTVGVEPEVAKTILTLVAEERAGVQLWISLAPLTPQQEQVLSPSRKLIPSSSRAQSRDPAEGLGTGGVEGTALSDETLSAKEE